MIIGLVHIIIVTVTVMFIVYLIVCTVRSLRVTVTINKILSYYYYCSGRFEKFMNINERQQATSNMLPVARATCCAGVNAA